MISYRVSGKGRKCLSAMRMEILSRHQPDSNIKRAARKEEIMSIRDLGKIELTVFIVLIVAFVVFFALYVMLRHQKQVSSSRRLLKKRARMEGAVQQKLYAESGGDINAVAARQETTTRAEYDTFTPQNSDRVQEEPQRRVRKIVRAQSRTESAGKSRKLLQEEYAEELSGEYTEKAFAGSGGAESTGFREEFAEGMDLAVKTSQKGQGTQEYSAGKKGKHGQEPLRMWDNNSKSVRTAKRSQQDPPFFVEERRISHRRDQLKRLEEAGKTYDTQI